MVAKNDLKVSIEADADDAEKAFDKASKAARRMEDQLSKAALAAAELDRELEAEAAKAAKQRADSLEALGKGLLAFGAATLTGLAIATKTAIEWESAWAGVRKTVDGSDAELATLEGELRKLATTLPATHQEIAGVAEAAGQLGIGVNDIAAFTKVMIDLGETTNLTAEEAAFAIARISNVMGTAASDVDRLGSTLVDLGNNAATTERDILEMAQRIAGAGNTVGLTEAEVLGFAAALSSVGIEAQAGGTAISKVMIEMANAAAEGGESLGEFAEVAGMSSEEFARAFEEDPAQAIQSFVAGLGRIDAAGGNVFATLDDLELSEIRVRDAMLRLSGAGELLSESLDRGANAWDENSALAAEAAQRYDTAEARIAVARNTLVDLAIDIGSVLLPMVAGLAETGADLLRWFADLPAPVKTVATILVGLAGTVALLGGGLLLLAPRIAAARAALTALATTAPKAAAALRAVSFAIPVVGILLGVAGGIAAIASASEDAGPSVGDMTRALLDLRDAKTSALIDGLRDSFRSMRGEMDKGGGSTLRAAASAMAWADGMERADEAVAALVEGGHLKQAREVAEALHEEFAEGGESVDEFAARILPGYVDALQNTEVQQTLTKESAGLLDDRLTELATRFGETGEDAEEAAVEMLDAWAGAFSDFVDLNQAYEIALSDKQAAEKEAAQATADATDDSSDSWEDYVGDVDLTMKEYQEQLKTMISAQEDWAANMISLAGRVPPEMLDYLAQLGPEGAQLVDDMAHATGKELRELVADFEQSGFLSGQVWADELASAGPLWDAIAIRHGQSVSDKLRKEVRERKRPFGEVLAEYGHLIETKIPDDKAVKIRVEKGFTTVDISRIVGIIRGLVPSFIGLPIRPIGRGLRGFADGGRPPMHEPVWVGERGKELVEFITPARVHSHSESVRMMSAAPAAVRQVAPPATGGSDGGSVHRSMPGRLGEGGTVNLNVQAWSDRFELRQIQDELAWAGVA